MDIYIFVHQKRIYVSIQDIRIQLIVLCIIEVTAREVDSQFRLQHASELAHFCNSKR